MVGAEGRAARDIVARAIATECAGAGADVASAFDRARQKLARSISPILGDAGFDAMFARAARKTLPTVGVARRFQPAEGIPFEGQFWEWVAEEGADVVRAIAIGTLTTFLESLTTMIGEELAFKLVRHAWPEAFDGSVSAEKS